MQRATSIPAWARRVLFHLEQAEAREPNPHLQADFRIAWITVLYAARGDPLPHVAATYQVLGLHPDLVWSAIVRRRKALLGSCYAEFWGEEISLPPKKPVQSEKVSRPLAKRAAA